MRFVWGYFGIAVALSVAFSLLLGRITAGEGIRTAYLVAAASVLALAWPLTLPMVAFGSVAATQLIRTALRKKAAAAGRAALVSPLGAKV
ncbi:MAG TPA: hypothetical protein VFA34_13830 [Actinomycetota bacterium]|jgi:hypothetical protein|nr:hypothetical protein [Actinomycetota bacterium]